MFPSDLSPTAMTVCVLWLAALGGAVGSFLNVVVYRLPKGMSLITPGSHCPACKSPIRWYDNVPVVSWLVLSARCRDCGCRISGRYPVVEGITALLFLVLGCVEVLCGGANLPARLIELPDALITPELTVGRRAGICGYHLLLLCTLMAAALVEYDGRRLPVRLIVPALAVGLLAPLLWPHLHPVAVSPKLDGWPAGLLDGLVGMAAGGLVGMVAGFVVDRSYRTGVLLGMACTGVMLGYQAVAALGVLIVLILVFQAMLRRLRATGRSVPPTAWLALATLAWILVWRPLVEMWVF